MYTQSNVKVVINGIEITSSVGSDIKILRDNGVTTVAGHRFTDQVINISVRGDLGSLSCNHANTIQVFGEVGTVNNISGNVVCMSGAEVVNNVSGSVKIINSESK